MRDLIPRPGIELATPEVEAQSPNHGIPREVPLFLVLKT